MRGGFSGSRRVAAMLVVALAIQPAAVSARAFPAWPEGFSQRILSYHNRERERLGIPTLRWSLRLSAQARQWALSLARRGVFEHSRKRGMTGENLWVGTAGFFSPDDMIGAFVAERGAFRPGRFPDVSQTGNWVDVGHYAQMIWPSTREVGCALASGHGRDVLVCRYWPAGNVRGRQVP